MNEEDDKPLVWSETEIPALALLPGLKRTTLPAGVSLHALADGDVAGPMLQTFADVESGDVAGSLPSYQPSEGLLSAQARAALWKRLAKTLFHEGTEQWEARNRKLMEENERLDDEIGALTSDFTLLTCQVQKLEELNAKLEKRLADKQEVDESDVKYVESIRKKLEDQKAAYDHKTLVNADLARRLETAEKHLLEIEHGTGKLIQTIREESVRASTSTVAEVKALIGKLIAFIASGAPDLVRRKPVKAAPAKSKATQWPKAPQWSGTHARMREQVREKFKDSPVRKAALKNAKKKAAKPKSAKKKSRK